MEFALKCGMWGLLIHEKIPESHVLATLLTGNAWLFNPIALRKAKTVYNFGLSECNRVNEKKIS